MKMMKVCLLHFRSILRNLYIILSFICVYIASNAPTSTIPSPSPSTPKSLTGGKNRHREKRKLGDPLLNNDSSRQRTHNYRSGQTLFGDRTNSPRKCMTTFLNNLYNFHQFLFIYSNDDH